MKLKTLSAELLQKIDVYWRAANYLSVGQLYLFDMIHVSGPGHGGRAVVLVDVVFNNRRKK